MIMVALSRSSSDSLAHDWMDRDPRFQEVDLSTCLERRWVGQGVSEASTKRASVGVGELKVAVKRNSERPYDDEKEGERELPAARKELVRARAADEKSLTRHCDRARASVEGQIADRVAKSGERAKLLLLLTSRWARD